LAVEITAVRASSSGSRVAATYALSIRRNDLAVAPD
jgi:hypothetical protein